LSRPKSAAANRASKNRKRQSVALTPNACLTPLYSSTIAALERQAFCNEFASVKDYLQEQIVSLLVEDEKDTVLSNDRRFVPGCYAEELLESSYLS
jgi:hypothetical protein